MSCRTEKTYACQENSAIANRECLTGCTPKLTVHNWMYNKIQPNAINKIVEVQFKNTRKGFYRNVNELNLRVGDIIAVEASPGHDIGTVTLTGELVFDQMHKYRISTESELKKVYRKAKEADIEKWEEAKALEHDTMIESRKLARDMGLNMKIGDVEYQGDKTKAIFYYIADERVDFRQLIKVLAEKYHIRVEMKQIGARQEAGLIGGIGSCGKELCCATWTTNFVSVSTNSARIQQLSINPQKLAGQCGKLKCCLNYELDSYIDTLKYFPNVDIKLKTKQGEASHQKTDVFKRQMFYNYKSDLAFKTVALSPERVRFIIESNKKGILPETWIAEEDQKLVNKKEIGYTNSVGEGKINRFENKNR